MLLCKDPDLHSYVLAVVGPLLWGHHREYKPGPVANQEVQVKQHVMANVSAIT